MVAAATMQVEARWQPFLLPPATNRARNFRGSSYKAQALLYVVVSVSLPSFLPRRAAKVGCNRAKSRRKH